MATGDGVSPSFRVAAPEDWSGIWCVFQAVVRSGDTYFYPQDISKSEAKELWFVNGKNNAWTFVAIVDDEIVGTAYLKPNAIGLGNHIANAGWMIAPHCAGKGVGRAFAHFVLDKAKGAGFYGMQFNAVIASNERAIALWKSLGFEIVGTVPDAFRHAERGLTAIHVMYARL